FGMDKPAVGYLVGGVRDGIRQLFRGIEHARMTIGTKSAATLSTGYLSALEYAQDRVPGAALTATTGQDAPRVATTLHPLAPPLLCRSSAVPTSGGCSSSRRPTPGACGQCSYTPPNASTCTPSSPKRDGTAAATSCCRW